MVFFALVVFGLIIGEKILRTRREEADRELWSTEIESLSYTNRKYEYILNYTSDWKMNEKNFDEWNRWQKTFDQSSSFLEFNIKISPIIGDQGLISHLYRIDEEWINSDELPSSVKILTTEETEFFGFQAVKRKENLDDDRFSRHILYFEKDGLVFELSLNWLGVEEETVTSTYERFLKDFSFLK